MWAKHKRCSASNTVNENLIKFQMSKTIVIKKDLKLIAENSFREQKYFRLQLNNLLGLDCFIVLPGGHKSTKRKCLKSSLLVEPPFI